MQSIFGLRTGLPQVVVRVLDRWARSIVPGSTLANCTIGIFLPVVRLTAVQKASTFHTMQAHVV